MDKYNLTGLQETLQNMSIHIIKELNSQNSQYAFYFDEKHNLCYIKL